MPLLPSTANTVLFTQWEKTYCSSHEILRVQPKWLCRAVVSAGSVQGLQPTTPLRRSYIVCNSLPAPDKAFVWDCFVAVHHAVASACLAVQCAYVSLVCGSSSLRPPMAVTEHQVNGIACTSCYADCRCYNSSDLSEKGCVWCCQGRSHPDGPTRVKVPNGHPIPARHTGLTTNTDLLCVYIHQNSSLSRRR
jgi:hypothetical protein